MGSFMIMLIFFGIYLFWRIDEREKKQKLKQRIKAIESNPTTITETPNGDDAEKTVAIRLNLDVDQILRNRAEFQKNRIKWSGKDYGPFPIKRFTDAQWSCIHDAVGRKRILIDDRFASRGDAPSDVAFHPARTVKSMVKHGFIEPCGNGIYICTDFGAKAFEQLPFS